MEYSQLLSGISSSTGFESKIIIKRNIWIIKILFCYNFIKIHVLCI